MIAKLRGLLDSVSMNNLIIDVNGVGYLVTASGRTIDRIGQIGDQVTLYIEMHVREDQMSLFGFIDEHEQDWFKLLSTVQGVGAKAALAILSVIPPEQLPVVIASQDKDMIRRADGVGPKLAMRIVTELKDKVGDMSLGQSATANDTGAVVSSAPATGDAPALDTGAAGDAVSALVNLGYARADAFSAVAKVNKEHEGNADLSTLIRDGLKELSA